MSRSSPGMVPDPFGPAGWPKNPGRCLVTISGAVAHPGVVEVDRGTSSWDIAMRSRPVEPAQALLVGGYGGAWVGPEHFGTPYASMSLRTIGAMAGVGVIVVLGERPAAWPNPHGSPATWPTRAQVSAVRVSTGSPPSLTISSRLTRGQGDDDSVARLHRRLARGQRAGGVPSSRWSGRPGAKCV